MRRAAATLLIAASLQLLTACPSANDRDPGEASVEPTREELETLAVLGYARHTDEEADPGRRSVTHLDASRAAPGFTLVTTPRCRAELVSLSGAVVHEWSEPEGCRSWGDTELLADGALLALGVYPKPHREGTNGHYLARIAWDGRIVSRRDVNAHHHVSRAATGGLVVLTREPQHVEAFGQDELQLVDHVTFVAAPGLEPTGTLSLLDAYRDSPRFELELPHGRWRHRRDLFHSNAVYAVLDLGDASDGLPFAPGHVLVTMRHQNVVAAIDPEAGRVVWEWGRGELEGPHDGHLLPNGHLLVFDNGVHRHWSRVVEVDPRSGEIVWRHRGRPPSAFFSDFRGASQRLPNGNTLITESKKGRVFEVTRAGELVWEFWNPRTNDENKRETIHRARRHAPGDFAGRGLGRERPTRYSPAADLPGAEPGSRAVGPTGPARAARRLR